MENWKPIPGFEGLYEASDLGRIRSCVGKVTSNARYEKRVWKSRIMRTKCLQNGKRKDKRITLWKDGVSKDFLVARLVASAWLGTPAGKMTVNHKNGDFLDNRPENLEWCSLADNIKHGFATGLYSSIQYGITLTGEDGTVYSFPSQAKASEFLGRYSAYISNLLGRGGKFATSKDGTDFIVKRI